MSDYKRLTDKKYRYKKCVGCKYGNCQYCDDDINYANEVHNRLAELEDKIEQGTLIELPCKVGDKIWVVDESWGWIEGKWGSTSEMHEGKAYSFTYYGNCIHVEDDVTSNVYLWGEDAFLTREEAEKRLKELQE